MDPEVAANLQELESRIEQLRDDMDSRFRFLEDRLTQLERQPNT
jgi:hypothetical protein